VLILGAACGRAPDQAARRAPVETAADRAVIVARAIRANPAAADSILAAHGLTRAGLDSLMYEIAADSALARAYTEATR
jgi:hypothetical protein